jgi:hypothetical protein
MPDRQVPDSKWSVSAATEINDLLQPRPGHMMLLGLCSLELRCCWRLFDSGMPGGTRCSRRAPRGGVSRVPNSYQIAVLDISVLRYGEGEDATNLKA